MFTDIYSPLQSLDFFPNLRVWIKRDDLIDPFISGNKWRKLKYILDEAERNHKNHLVTFGGAYSNHLVATAAACARKGLKSTAFVRGETVENEMLLCCKLYGMSLIFTDRFNYKHKTLLFEQHFGENQDAFFVDEGGAGLNAVKGCAEIIGELHAETAHLFCAAGTGTTAAGLLKGIQERGLKTKLHVVPVLKGAGFIADEIMAYTGADERLVLHNGYHFGGYAKTQSTLIEFMKQFIASTGIMIDPVYTAKMFYALQDLQQGDYFKSDEPVVALHTGGLLGLLGMKEKFH